MLLDFMYHFFFTFIFFCTPAHTHSCGVVDSFYVVYWYTHLYTRMFGLISSLQMTCVLGIDHLKRKMAHALLVQSEPSGHPG